VRTLLGRPLTPWRRRLVRIRTGAQEGWLPWFVPPGRRCRAFAAIGPIRRSSRFRRLASHSPSHNGGGRTPIIAVVGEQRPVRRAADSPAPVSRAARARSPRAELPAQCRSGSRAFMARGSWRERSDREEWLGLAPLTTLPPVRVAGVLPVPCARTEPDSPAQRCAPLGPPSSP